MERRLICVRVVGICFSGEISGSGEWELEAYFSAYIVTLLLCSMAKGNAVLCITYFSNLEGL